jgi:hypothetical protein
MNVIPTIVPQAEQLRTYTIVMPSAAREVLRDPDEFYAQDLIGSFAFLQVSLQFDSIFLVYTLCTERY